VRTYYDRPVLKAPVWRWMVPAYFFSGGVAAGTSLVAAGARFIGDDALARRCVLTSLGAVTVSTGLLVADLGRSSRFLNMLRVAKPTSPMSVGSWVLSTFATATGLAATAEVLGVRRPGRVAEAVAAVLAPVMATYTAVLVADTAVPAWHEARAELPFVFAGSALASGAGLALLLAPVAETGVAVRRAAAAGTLLELGAARRMERRLGELAQPYRSGRAGLLRRLATAASATGALAMLAHRTAPLGGALLLLGAAAERFTVFYAGVASAVDPVPTIAPQRRRLEASTPTR
jgi:hypothetical protein